MGAVGGVEVFCFFVAVSLNVLCYLFHALPKKWAACGCPKKLLFVSNRASNADVENESYFALSSMDGRHLTTSHFLHRPWLLLLRALELAFFVVVVACDGTTGDKFGTEFPWPAFFTSWCFVVFGAWAFVGAALTASDIWRDRSKLSPAAAAAAAAAAASAAAAAKVEQEKKEEDEVAERRKISSTGEKQASEEEEEWRLRRGGNSSEEAAAAACSSAPATPQRGGGGARNPRGGSSDDLEAAESNKKKSEGKGKPSAAPSPASSSVSSSSVDSRRPLTAAAASAAAAAAATAADSKRRQRRRPQQQQQPAQLPPLPPLPMDLPHRLYSLLSSVAGPSAIFVALLYWLVLRKYVAKAERERGEAFDPVDAMLHGGSAALVMLDALLSRTPAASSHFQVTLAYGTAYSVFIWAYERLTGRFLYGRILAWSRPTAVAFYGFALPGSLLACFAAWCLLAAGREALGRKRRRGKASEEAGGGAVAAEQAREREREGEEQRRTKERTRRWTEDNCASLATTEENESSLV